MSFQTVAAATRDAVNKGYLMNSAAEHNALLRWLKANGKIKEKTGASRWYTQVQLKKSTNAKWIGRFGTAPTAAQDMADRAYYDKKRVLCPIAIDEQDIRDNEGDDSEIFNLIDEQVMGALDDVESELAVDLCTANNSSRVDTSRISGLESAIRSDTATASPGNLSGATYSNWRCQVESAFTFSSAWETSLMDLYLACVNRNDNPDLILTTTAVWREYFKVLQPNQRYSDVSAANAGFKNLTFMETPMIYDNNLTAKTILMLNTKYIELWVDAKANMMMKPFHDATAFGQDARIGGLVWSGALAFKNLNRQGYTIIN